ncbi:ArnT family glycosyltransferase [Desulfurivibrio sp. D14AmB]|uniref:ArnT family glycosyltransferase n=1 Tax=Desulfurivibrio sp. D14AmB TaxID=3374370 RepID=UPI00376F1F83
MNERSGLGRADERAAHLLIAGLGLLLPLLLYQLRHLDDNSLTSWYWVFQVADPWRLFLGLLLLTPLCWLLARLPEWRGWVDLLPGRPLLLLPPLAFLVCLPFLDTPEVIVDAARYFLQAKNLSIHGPAWFFREWGREIFAWTDLPLIPLIYGLLLSFFEESRLALQLFNALLFALTALLIAVLGRDLWDRETGVAGALFFLGFPYLYSQTPLLLVDIGTMFFLLLAMVAFQRALVRGGYCYPVLCALAVAAVLLSKYSAWLLLSALLPVLLCSLERGRGLVLRRAALALLPALLLVGPLFWYHREVMATQILLLLEFQKPGLAGWSESLISTFYFQTHPLLTAAALYSLYRAGRLRDPRYLILLWPVLLLLVLLEVRRIRYSIPIFPLLALLAAYGLRDLEPPALRRHLLLLVAASSLLLAYGGFLPFLQSMSERNLQQAGRYLDTLAVEGVEVVVVPSTEPAMDPRMAVPLLDLFTGRPLAYHPSSPVEPPPGVATSSLRFTWELPLPRFYATLSQSVRKRALVLILPGEEVELSGDIEDKIRGLELLRRFAVDSGAFQHRTLVEVYGAAPD